MLPDALMWIGGVWWPDYRPLRMERAVFARSLYRFYRKSQGFEWLHWTRGVPWPTAPGETKKLANYFLPRWWFESRSPGTLLDWVHSGRCMRAPTHWPGDLQQRMTWLGEVPPIEFANLILNRRTAGVNVVQAVASGLTIAEIASIMDVRASDVLHAAWAGVDELERNDRLRLWALHPNLEAIPEMARLGVHRVRYGPVSPELLDSKWWPKIWAGRFPKSEHPRWQPNRVTIERALEIEWLGKMIRNRQES